MKSSIKHVVTLVTAVAALSGISQSARALPEDGLPGDKQFEDRKVVGILYKRNGDIEFFTDSPACEDPALHANIAGCSGVSDGTSACEPTKLKGYAGIVASLTAAYLSGAKVTITTNAGCRITKIRMGGGKE